MSGIEHFDLNAAVAQTISLGIDDIFRLLQESDFVVNGNKSVKIEGNADDSFVIDGSGANFTTLGSATGSTTIGGDTYDIYNVTGSYTLLIDQDMAGNVSVI